MLASVFTVTPYPELLDLAVETADRLPSYSALSAVDRPWFVLLLANLLERQCKANWSQSHPTAQVCIPLKASFYSENGEYLTGHPTLRAFMGAGKIHLRRAHRLVKVLESICFVEKGNIVLAYDRLTETFSPRTGSGLVTTATLKPIAEWGWDLTAEENKKFLRKFLRVTTNKRGRISYAQETLAVCRVKIDGKIVSERPASKRVIRLISNYNQKVRDWFKDDADLFRVFASYGETELKHGRIHSQFTQMRKDDRTALMESFGWVEDDLSAFAMNALYLLETDEMYQSEKWGNDIYSAVLSHTVFCKQNPAYIPLLRPVIKELMTIGIGATAKSDKLIAVRIANILTERGLQYRVMGEARWMRYNKKKTLSLSDEKRKEMYHVYKKEATAKALEKKAFQWRRFCMDHGLPVRYHSAPPIILGDEILAILRQHFKPVYMHFYKGAHEITTNIETRMNLKLIAHCVTENIPIITLHDAMYCKPESMEALCALRSTFLQEAVKEIQQDRALNNIKPLLLHITKTDVINRIPIETIRESIDTGDFSLIEEYLWFPEEEMKESDLRLFIQVLKDLFLLRLRENQEINTNQTTSKETIEDDTFSSSPSILSPSSFSSSLYNFISLLFVASNNFSTLYGETLYREWVGAWGYRALERDVGWA